MSIVETTSKTKKKHLEFRLWSESLTNALHSSSIDQHPNKQNEQTSDFDRHSIKRKTSFVKIFVKIFEKNSSKIFFDRKILSIMAMKWRTNEDTNENWTNENRSIESNLRKGKGKNVVH